MARRPGDVGDAVTSQVELERFFEQVRAHQARARGAAAAGAGEGGQVGELLDELALVTEMLLTAEEELRVQNEQLSAARLELDRLYARNEALFGAAAAAYVITDGHGMVVDSNRAASQLLGYTTAAGVRSPDRDDLCSVGQPAGYGAGRSCQGGGRPATDGASDLGIRDRPRRCGQCRSAQRTPIGGHAVALAAHTLVRRRGVGVGRQPPVPDYVAHDRGVIGRLAWPIGASHQKLSVKLGSGSRHRDHRLSSPAVGGTTGSRWRTRSR